MKRKLIIAHRGDTSSAVENTISAFWSTIKKCADMIELDIRRTADGQLIVHHNQDIGKHLIKDMHWRDIDLVNQRRNFEVSKFEDVLKATRGKIKLDVELKETGYEEEVIGIILKFFDYRDFVVTSCNDSSIRKIKEHYPEVKTGLLLGGRKSKVKLAFELTKLFSRKKHRQMTADYFVPHVFLVQLGFLKKVEKYNKMSIVWGVNNKKMIQKMLQDERVAGIITDKLDKALEIRKSLEE